MDSRPRRNSANYAYLSPPDPLRRTVLSQRRKDLIIEFKNNDKMGTGSDSWVKRLHKHVEAVDRTVTLDDIERWIKSYPWIVDEKVATTPPPTNKSVQRTPSNSSKGKPSGSSGSETKPDKAPSPSAEPTTTTISKTDEETIPSTPTRSNTRRKSNSSESFPVNAESSPPKSKSPPLASYNQSVIASSTIRTVTDDKNIDRQREAELEKPEVIKTESKNETSGTIEMISAKYTSKDDDRLNKFNTTVLWKTVILKEAIKRGAISVSKDPKALALKMMAKHLRQKIDRMMVT